MRSLPQNSSNLPSKICLSIGDGRPSENPENSLKIFFQDYQNSFLNVYILVYTTEATQAY